MRGVGGWVGASFLVLFDVLLQRAKKNKLASRWQPKEWEQSGVRESEFDIIL